MRNFKDIIIEKLKVSIKDPEWTKTTVPMLNIKTLVQFAKLFVENLGDRTELSIDDIYEYLDIKLPEDVTQNVVQSKSGKSFRKVKYVDYLMSIECHEHSQIGYIVTLIYGTQGRSGTWKPVTDKSLIDFMKILGNGDEETGRTVFDNILKKMYYEAKKYTVLK